MSLMGVVSFPTYSSAHLFFLERCGEGAIKMPKLKYTKQECVSKLIELQDMIGWDKGLTQDILEKNKIYKTVLTHWGSITNMRNELHLPELGINNHGKYSKNELIKILDDFIKQYGFFPSSEYWDKNQKELKLPSSAVYIRYFKSWKNLRELFNYSNGNYIKNRDGIFVNKYDNKAELYARVGKADLGRLFLQLFQRKFILLS